MDHQNNVFWNYQQKKYSACLKLINAMPASLCSSSHYKVLKAACLVNLETRFDEAHQTLDEVLDDEIDNAFALYCKGLAFFHQQKMPKAILCFDKAIEHDKLSSMEMAKVMKTKAEKVFAEENLKANKENDEKKNEHNKKKKLVINKLPEVATTIASQSQISIADVTLNKEETIPKSNEDRLTSEKETKSSVKPSKTCKICSKTFSKAFSFTRHMQMHTGERPHKCSQCRFAFIQKSDLQRHIASHHCDSFDFECPVCRKQFKTKKNLQCHQVTHVQERPFQCSLCPKSFKLSKLLKFHENLHSSSNPIRCDMCGKAFAAKGYVIAHMKSHVNFKPFGCNLCKRFYSNLANLGMHFREFHGVGKATV